MAIESPVPILPMLLRPSGATLYRLRLESAQQPMATAESQIAQRDLLLDWQTGDCISAVAGFTADHPGFQGHFPDRPILPGFLHIQLAVDIVRIYEPQAELTAILSAKFHRPILPGAEIQVELLRQSQNQATALLRIGEEAASRIDFGFYTGSGPASAAAVLQTS